MKKFIVGLSIGVIGYIFCGTTMAATFDVGAGDIGGKVGDWDISLVGEVNGFYATSDCDNSGEAVGGGLSCTGGDTSAIRNGLLPAAFIFNGSTVQAGFNLGFQLGIFPGINNRVDGGVNGVNGNAALGTAGADFRLVNFTFGQESWGSFLIGRGLGVFGRDAILLDMTIAGVGANLGAGTPPNTSLGRIGVGYLYADFQPQITYTTPNFGGFQASLGVFQPLDSLNFSTVSGSATEHNDPHFQGGVSYSQGGLFGGTGDIKVWGGAIWQDQEVEGTNANEFDHTGEAYEVGAKLAVGNAEFVGYYYDGEGIGSTAFFFDSVAQNGNERDSDGFYVQATYKLFGKTKFGLSYGESNLDTASGEADSILIEQNSSVIGGIYHQLTRSLQLVAEYTDQESEAHNGNENEEKTLSLGAILFF